ncbi:MAG: hypothetical protein V1725_07875 [archaeon]
MLDDPGYGGGTASGHGFDDGTGYGGGTEVIFKDNVVGTKYARTSTTVSVELDNKCYDVVCTYNDLSIIALLRSKRLTANLDSSVQNGNMGWEVDLDIVNVKIDKKWTSPSTLPKKEKEMIYLICVKQILEETFDVKLYELETVDDYNSQSKWKQAYNRTNLSRDSLYSDIMKVLK